MTEQGHLLWSALGLLKRQFLSPPKYRQASELALLLEELIHRSQYLVQKDAQARAGVVWRKLTRQNPSLPPLVQATYTSTTNWGRLGMEYLRMLVQVRGGYPLSEEFYLDATDLRAALMKPQTREVEHLIAQVMEMLRSGTAPRSENVSPPTGADEVYFGDTGRRRAGAVGNT